MYKYRSALLALLLLLLPMTALAVGQGRLQATVVDENDEPLPGVQITVTNDEIAYEKTLETNKKGRFTLLVIDATRVYDFKFEKEGYRTVNESFKIEPGSVTRETFKVPSLEAAPVAPSAEELAAQRGRNKAINAFNEGVLAVQQGDDALAKASFLEAQELDPDMPETYSALAGIFLEEEQYEKAVEQAQGLLERDPNNPRGLQTLYDAYEALGQSDKAQEALDQLSAMEGGGRDAAVRVFNLGAEAARVGDLDAARTYFEKAAELDPELAPAHAALARVYFDLERYSDVTTSAEAAMAVDPTLTDLQRLRYEAYRRMGETEKAQEVFAEMAESDPQGLAQTLYERGKELFDANQTAQAQTAFEQALQADEEFARAHYMLGLCYVNTGESGKAKQHFERFLELAPDDPEAGTAREMLQVL